MSTETPTEDDVRTEVSNFLRRNFPQIQLHGGEASIVEVDVDNKSVTIQLGGACSGCGISPTTTHMIKQRMVQEVDAIDHVETIVGMGMGSGTSLTTGTPMSSTRDDDDEGEKDESQSTIDAPF